MNLSNNSIITWSSGSVPSNPSSRRARSRYTRVGEDALIDNRWRVGRVIGSGTYGMVYEAYLDVSDSRVPYGRKFVVKTEKTGHKTLRHEASVYRLLRGVPGFPTLHFAGKHGSENVLVMQKLGMDLHSLLDSQGGLLTAKDALLITYQLLRRLKALHSTGYVHSVLHPGNVMLASAEDLIDRNAESVYLIDLGDAMPFLKRDGSHLRKENTGEIVGTLPFGSVSMLKGYTQSRRDDLESLVYLMVYLYNGRLPWTGEKDVDVIARRKREVGNRELTRGFPLSAASFSAAIRAIRFDQAPNYNKLFDYLKKALASLRARPYDTFDWQIRALRERERQMRMSMSDLDSSVYRWEKRFLATPLSFGFLVADENAQVGALFLIGGPIAILNYVNHTSFQFETSHIRLLLQQLRTIPNTVPLYKNW